MVLNNMDNRNLKKGAIYKNKKQYLFLFLLLLMT